MLDGNLVEQAEHPDGLVLVALLAGEESEAKQAEGGRRVPGGDGRVVEILAAGGEALVVVGGGEEAAVLGVGEVIDRRFGERRRLAVPALLERRLVQGEERLEQEGMVLKVGAQPSAAVLPG